MLVLSRRRGETILIYPAKEVSEDVTVGELFAGGPIRVGVAHVGANEVRIGVEAPAELVVLRAELIGGA